MLVSLTIAAILLLGLVGYLRMIRGLQRFASGRRQVDEFQATLGRYLSSQGRDMDAYVQLTERAFAVQKFMGAAGVFSTFRPPFGRYEIRNYQIVVNSLPALRQAYEDAQRGLYWDDHTINAYSSQLQEALFRYRGWSLDILNELTADARNPLNWLREGVATTLLAPVILLRWLGVAGTFGLDSASRSGFVRFVSGLITIVGLVASIMGIVLGWEELLGLLF